MFKFPKLLIKSVAYSISFILIFSDMAFAAANVANVYERTDKMIEDIVSGSKPSDIPIAGVSDFFEKESVHLLKNFDLTKYIGKKVFVGYGLYDHAEDHCKYLEQPNVDRAEYDTIIHFKAQFNDHTYAVSQKNMTYTECENTAKRLGGSPAIVDSAAEAQFLASTFTKVKKDNKLIGDSWIGIKKENCNVGTYKNALGKKQDYFNWTNNQEPFCDNSTLHVKMDIYGKFVPSAENASAKCLMEFDSLDVYRPVKVCAPWWRITRDYDGIKQTLYDINMLNRINQADVPTNMVMCTKYQKDVVAKKDPKNQPTRIAHCTEYYDRTIAPECLDNPNQRICFVDECKGYINNACRLVRKDKVGKGYVKGEISYKGKITETKNKVDIITKEFECPASTISDKHCVEQSSVVVYPKECPGSQCSELKTCVYEAGADNEALDKCYLQFKCEKIYGNRDIPPKINANGDVTHVYGKCSDGSILEFPVNLEKKLDKRCLKYEVLTRTEQIVEKCVEERKHHDHEVNMAITDKDIYEDDPNCVRLDDVHDSQIKHSLTVKFTPENYFKMKVSQVNLDGTTSIIGDDMGSDLYLVAGANMGSNGYKIKFDEKPALTLEQGDTNPDTGKKLPSDPSQVGLPSHAECSDAKSWEARNTNIFSTDGDESESGYSLSDLWFPNGSSPKLKISDPNFKANADCDNKDGKYPALPQMGTLLQQGVCLFDLPSSSADSKITDFQAHGQRASFNLSGVADAEACKRQAYCFHGIYSFNQNKCTIIQDGDSDAADNLIKEMDAEAEKKAKDMAGIKKDKETLSEKIDAVGTESARPKAGKPEQRTALMNGLQSIFVFEDYARGGWGYYSNHNAWPAYVNQVEISIGGNEFKMLTGGDKKMTKITDLLNYGAALEHVWHRAKKPNVPVTMITGAATAAAMYAMYGALAAIPVVGWIILVVIVIVTLILTAKSKKMDEQNNDYHLYKDVPVEFYFPGFYETRIPEDKSVLLIQQKTPPPYEGKDPKNPIIDSLITAEEGGMREPPANVRLNYWKSSMRSGRDKPHKTRERVVDIFLKTKHSVIESLGISKNEIPDNSWERGGNDGGGYPKCKWYKPSCQKSEAQYRYIYTPNSMIPYEFTSFQEGEENYNRTGKVKVNVPLGEMKNLSGYRGIPINKIRKETTTVYLNADNTVIILVPYSGDYELSAFDKYGNLLSKQTITKDLFVKKHGSGVASAQVKFGRSMQLAHNISEGLNSHACRDDRAVEWGGGVSGTFFENQRTAESDFCQKSIDMYVKDRSAVKIEVKPLNMDRSFVFNLKKPLPFANRVWITSLDMEEVRRYRCFDPFNNCSDEDYKINEKGNR